MARMTGEVREQAKAEAARWQADGLTYDAIAERMGIGRGCVAGLLRDWRAERERAAASDVTGVVTEAADSAQGVVSPVGAGESTLDPVTKSKPAVWERLGDIADEINELRDEEEPILTHVDMTAHCDGPVAIMFASCSHLGGRWTNHAAFKALIHKVIAQDGLYIATLGDEIEGFIPGFRDVTAVGDQPLGVPLQERMVKSLVAELVEADKLVCGAGSQHGAQWQERNLGKSPMNEIYRTVGLPWFTGQAYVKLHVGAQTYNLAIAHEFPGHSQYNLLHPHARAHRFNFPMADVVVQGDKHTYAMEETTTYVWEYDAGNRPSPFVWFVQTGTAKTGPDPYTVRNWSRGVFEWPTLIFHADSHQIEGTRHLSTVKHWLRDVKHSTITWQVVGTSATPELFEEPVIPGTVRGAAIRGAQYSGEH